MTATPRPERRRCRRVDAKAPMEIRVAEHRAEGTALDLSAAGVRCLVAEEFKPFEKVAVRLTLGTPTGQAHGHVRAQGVVVRATMIPAGADSPPHALYEVAVFFSEIDPRARTVLERFVQAHLQRWGGKGQA